MPSGQGQARKPQTLSPKGACRLLSTTRCIGCHCKEQPQCCLTLLALGRLGCAASTEVSLAHQAEVRHLCCLLCAVLSSRPSYYAILYLRPSQPVYRERNARGLHEPVVRSAATLFISLPMSHVSKLQYFSLLWSASSAA